MWYHEAHVACWKVESEGLPQVGGRSHNASLMARDVG